MLTPREETKPLEISERSCFSLVKGKVPLFWSWSYGALAKGPRSFCAVNPGRVVWQPQTGPVAPLSLDNSSMSIGMQSIDYVNDHTSRPTSASAQGGA